MGKGDKKSRKGKIIMGSFGKTRKRRKKKNPDTSGRVVKQKEESNKTA
ncbi:MAG TPA: 30S ribosomal protein THX [Bacteroidia bacterium]|nr:30S ribosomal protein THX [Bacteroidia bacterium]